MSRATPGDEVFFHHKGEPKVGKVLCVGKHGCHVEDDGGARHKLKWHHLNGHKSRVQQDYKVLHYGEDGMIIENQHGKRRFVGIPPEAREERLQLQPQLNKQRPNHPDAPGRASGG